ncbi:MAG: undecaprenyl-phosphate galactose phosphotransferase WbaP [Nitrospirae bacterium]|nr:undecaprenyl-phosphate galactose phosphotransferase WbaP [Nitrospirota bacterium]
MRVFQNMPAMKTVNRFRAATEVITIFLVDMFSILAVFELAVAVRVHILPYLYSGFATEVPFSSFTDIWWLFLIWLFFFSYEGLYTKRFSFWDEIKALCKVSFFSTIGVFTIVSIGKLSGDISRTVVILMGIFSIVLFPVIRTIIKKFFRHLGFLKRKVLILGAGKTGRLLASALKREPNYGYEVVGFLDDDSDKLGMRIDGIKVHRGVNEAGTYLKKCDITDIFIAMPGAGKERLQGLINDLQHKVERILFVPDMFGIAVLGTGLKHFFHEEVLAFEIENNLSNPLNMFIKRSFDMVVSLFLIPFLAVPMVVMAALIRLDSKGPAIFTQDRIGERGMIFKCFKFRTMYPDAEDRLSGFLKNHPEAQNEWERHWKLRDDPRVTRIGRLLRTTSLDELPQIFNVLKGEMSLVGPRPYLLREREDMGEHDRTILLTKPGITGLWQVSGRSNTNYDYRITLDLWYVRNWNLWLDIVILLKTVKIVIQREGAY